MEQGAKSSNASEELMRKAVFGFALSAMLLAVCLPANSQQPKKVPRVGILAAQSPSSSSYRVEAFRKGLIELGYTEGKNIAIEHRYADGTLQRLPDLAAELIRLKVDIILSIGYTRSPCRQAGNHDDPYCHDRRRSG
jgi:putative ABC transport system substrate-binding protein